MSQVETIERERFEFEKTKEKKRLRFEYVKLCIQIGTVVISLFGAYIAFSKYLDEKQRERDLSYFNTLDNLNENKDSNIRKASLLKLCRFEDKYAEIAPILINFLEERKRQGDDTFDQTLLVAFLMIGQPMVQELARENRNSFGEDEDRFNVVQWAITELIKKDIGNKLKEVDLHGIFLEGVELKKLAISGIILKEATMNNVNFNGTSFVGIDLSGVIFTDCLFWRTTFGKGTNLKKATFRESTFNNAIFDTNLTDAKFPGSTCENIIITNRNYIVNDTFQGARPCTFSVEN